MRNSAYIKTDALFFLLEDWKQGQLAKRWKLRSVLGEAYSVYEDQLSFYKATVEELYGICERTTAHKKFAAAIAWYNLDGGRDNVGTDGNVPIERIEEILNEMTDDERRHLNDDIVLYDAHTENYTFDTTWWFENSHSRHIFKKADTRSYIEKRTSALMDACEYLIDAQHDADATEDSSEMVDFKGTLAEMLAKLKAE